jgi:hypothetical protein
VPCTAPHLMLMLNSLCYDRKQNQKNRPQKI